MADAKKETELDKARGTTEAQQSLADYHRGDFQKTDPVTGEPRGPTGGNWQDPDNLPGPIGEENQPADTAKATRAPADASDDYDSWTAEDLRAEAGDMEVTRGDGGDGSPLKADYVRALRERDRAR